MRSGVRLSSIDNGEHLYTCAGDPVHVIYSPVIDETGKFHLEPSGKEYIPDMIQSYAAQTDMSYILARLHAGDTSILRDDSAAMYGDFTDLPTSRAAMMQSFIDSQLVFDKLPLKVRSEFNNDFRQWFVQAGSADWISKMGIKIGDQVVPDVVPAPVVVPSAAAPAASAASAASSADAT